jgi:hypothetical protein
MMVAQTFLDQRDEGVALDAFGEGKVVSIDFPVALELDGGLRIA